MMIWPACAPRLSWMRMPGPPATIVTRSACFVVRVTSSIFDHVTPSSSDVMT